MSYLGSVLLVGRVSLLAQGCRRMTIALLVLLPALLFAAMRTTGRSLATAALGTGVAWSMAILASFSVVSSAGLDARLMLTGLKASRIFIGRLLSLLLLVIAVAVVLGLIIPVFDSDVSFTTIATGLLMAGTVGVAAGTLLGVVLPGELESVLVIIGIFGVPLGPADKSPVLPYVPSYGSISYLGQLGERTDSSYFIHDGLVFVVTLAVAFVLWLRVTKRANAFR